MPHSGNCFCWWAKLSEGLAHFLLPVLGDLERRWVPPSFLCLPCLLAGQRQRKSWDDNVREMDRPEFRQVPEGSEEQGKWRKLVAKSSVVPPTTLAVRG